MQTTELLERYLQAVRYWLPRSQQHDMIAELAEDIRSQIAEKEGELGREMNESELEAILKCCGSPFVVAHRYLPPQYLIGPVLCPIYFMLLKWFAFVWVIPCFLVWLGFVIFSPDYRAHNPAAQLNGLWLSVLYTVFNTTLGFAIAEKLARRKASPSRDWNPRQLPALFNYRRISRGNAVFAIIMNFTILACWLRYMPSKPEVMVAGNQLSLAHIWPLVFWSIPLLATAKTTLWSVNLLRPYWTRCRLMVRVAIDSAAAIALCFLFKEVDLIAISSSSVSKAKSWQDMDAFNATISDAFWIVLAVGIMAILFDLHRLMRCVRQQPPVALASP